MPSKIMLSLMDLGIVSNKRHVMQLNLSLHLSVDAIGYIKLLDIGVKSWIKSGCWTHSNKSALSHGPHDLGMVS